MSLASWLLLTAVVVEFLLFTFLRNLFGPFISPVVLWLAGVGVGVSGLWAFRSQPLPALNSFKQRQVGLLLPLAALVLFGTRIAKMLQRMPIDPAQSDVIPLIQVVVRRWLASEPVYVPIHDFGYLLYPTYLPLTWLPFVPAELLAFDYRWIAFGGFGIGILVGASLLLRRRLPLPAALGLLAVPLLLLQGLLQTNPSTLTNTVELLIVGFYLLLAYSVWRGPWWAQALALTCCLLSRFSLVFWVPLWLALLWQQAGRGVALRVAGLTAALILAIYVVPFLSHDWGAFARAQLAYTNAAIGEWEQLTFGQPEHLYRGVGLAIFFHRFTPGPLAQQVQLVRLVHACACVAVVVAAATYWFRQRPRLDYRVFALLALKVYLATFYAFVQVPYIYLTLVGVALAWPILLLLPTQSAGGAGGAALSAES
ncbi:hypothetical protein J0X19_23285 [Hymenobacter sp. BT186]|uniref:Uncharacterized protein n=1 Tax=Hymenobacter telluris TaxID=2816474 RepID=A0A939F0G9_9BACT|nr:hypothetical protein [Hymenobacter telluris]MBO0360903.1 hypothetical protein [Hymenobacter telluris]MBW3376932.1 hypothetical protein [Hymenobacter norwichensis]